MHADQNATLLAWKPPSDSHSPCLRAKSRYRPNRSPVSGCAWASDSGWLEPVAMQQRRVEAFNMRSPDRQLLSRMSQCQGKLCELASCVHTHTVQDGDEAKAGTAGKTAAHWKPLYGGCHTATYQKPCRQPTYE